MIARTLRRWDSVLVDLEPHKGSEQGGRRPCLVVSNDGFNHHSHLITVVPITKQAGKRRRMYGFEVALPAKSAGNSVDSIVMPQQIRTVAASRVARVLGRLDSPGIRSAIEERLMDHLGIGFEEDVEV